MTAALPVLASLVQCPLPGLRAAAPDAGAAVTELLRRCPKAGHPIAQACFRLLAGMLRQCEAYAPPTGQLRFLLGWAYADMEESAGQQSAQFALLRAILARKLLVPEVYDVMGRVQVRGRERAWGLWGQGMGGRGGWGAGLGCLQPETPASKQSCLQLILSIRLPPPHLPHPLPYPIPTTTARS